MQREGMVEMAEMGMMKIMRRICWARLFLSLLEVDREEGVLLDVRMIWDTRVAE